MRAASGPVIRVVYAALLGPRDQPDQLAHAARRGPPVHAVQQGRPAPLAHADPQVQSAPPVYEGLQDPSAPPVHEDLQDPSAPPVYEGLQDPSAPPVHGDPQGSVDSPDPQGRSVQRAQPDRGACEDRKVSRARPGRRASKVRPGCKGQRVRWVPLDQQAHGVRSDRLDQPDPPDPGVPLGRKAPCRVRRLLGRPTRGPCRSARLRRSARPSARAAASTRSTRQAFATVSWGWRRQASRTHAASRALVTTACSGPDESVSTRAVQRPKRSSRSATGSARTARHRPRPAKA